MSKEKTCRRQAEGAKEGGSVCSGLLKPLWDTGKLESGRSSLDRRQEEGG